MKLYIYNYIIYFREYKLKLNKINIYKINMTDPMKLDTPKPQEKQEKSNKY